MVGGSLPGDRSGTSCREHERTRGEREGRSGRGGGGGGRGESEPEGGMAAEVTVATAFGGQPLESLELGRVACGKRE
jgi:hypothetical protein